MFFDNMLLRRIFVPRRDEVTLECKSLYQEELNDYYTSPINVRVIKSRRMRRAGNVRRMGEERCCIVSWWGKWREGDHWGIIGLDEWIIIGWISRKWDVFLWTGLGWPRVERVGEHL